MKESEIWNYSNPLKVQQMANKYLGDIDVYLSTRKNKKYMIRNDNKWIHFGQMGYMDGTLDDDDRDNRRKRFLKRNAKWSKADKYTPAFLSYYLLWS